MACPVVPLRFTIELFCALLQQGQTEMRLSSELQNSSSLVFANSDSESPTNAKHLWRSGKESKNKSWEELRLTLLSLLQKPKMTTAMFLLPEDELTHRRPHPATSPKVSTNSVNDHPKPTDTKGHTLTWDEIPDWRRDNEYITGGYRRLQYSFQGCFYSVFAYLHNETVNIHSHLWGALLFIYFLISFPYIYMSQYDATTTWFDLAVFAIFLLSAVIYLLFSAGYHTFDAHSKSVATQCHTLDYTGIISLIMGSFFPCIYYGFYCDPTYQVIYLTGLTVIGAGAAYIVLNPEYRKPTHRGARTSVFIALGLCGVIPTTHALISHGYDKLCYEMGFRWVLLSGALYIVGALLYANRIPEKLSPGTFNYFGSSHQIFHLCVVLAALAHYTCVLLSFDYWHSRGAMCPI